MPKRTFVICTKDFSGEGWATILKKEGNKVILGYENPDVEDDEKKSYGLVGKGLVDRFPMKDLFAARAKLKDAYFIFDMNHLSDYSDKLRKEGFKVFGASKFQEKLEDDREFAQKLHKQYGLDTPPSSKFGNIQQGLSFLDQNKDKAYVFKPDAADASHLTFVPNSEKPEAANREMYDYMKSLSYSGTFILQEKVKGVEANFEVWLHKGVPCFSFYNFECKRKLAGDLGENVGCAFDFGSKVPLDSMGIKETIGKVLPLFEKMKYTGFADVNVIVADNKNYYLESCGRFGYNSHPNLFLNLAMDPIGDILADLIDGKIENMDKRFRHGFGASATLYIDHNRDGLPIYIGEDAEKSFFPFDLYKDGEQMKLAGFGNQAGIICGFGYTMTDAAHEMLENAEKINYPDKAFRNDLTDVKNPNSPLKRHEALRRMGYIT